MPDLLIMIWIIIGMLLAIVHENVEKLETCKALITTSIFLYGLALAGILMNMNGG